MGEAAAARAGLHLRRPRRHSTLRTGVIGGVALGVAYAAIVGGASRSLGHLGNQIQADWYFLVPLMGGFGVQVGLLSELRHRHRVMRAAGATGVAGAAGSTMGMIACCAHHIADLAPLAGASAAATFLTAYKVPFILVGLGANAVGIALTARRLHRTPPAMPVDPSQGTPEGGSG